MITSCLPGTITVSASLHCKKDMPGHVSVVFHQTKFMVHHRTTLRLTTSHPEYFAIVVAGNRNGRTVLWGHLNWRRWWCRHSLSGATNLVRKFILAAESPLIHPNLRSIILNTSLCSSVCCQHQQGCHCPDHEVNKWRFLTMMIYI